MSEPKGHTPKRIREDAALVARGIAEGERQCATRIEELERAQEVFIRDALAATEDREELERLLGFCLEERIKDKHRALVLAEEALVLAEEALERERDGEWVPEFNDPPDERPTSSAFYSKVDGGPDAP